MTTKNSDMLNCAIFNLLEKYASGTQNVPHFENGHKHIRTNNTWKKIGIKLLSLASIPPQVWYSYNI